MKNKFTQNRQNPLSTKLRSIALELSQLMFPLAGSLFDKPQARYWRALSVRRMSGVLLGLFFTVGDLAFFIDLISWQRFPMWALLIFASLFGGAGVVLFLTMRDRQLKFVPGLAILIALLAFSGKWLPHGPEVPVPAAVRSRIVLDAVGLFATSMLGYRLFLRFIGSEGLEQIRVQTELELAQDIQQTLVPPVTYQTDTVEVYGISLPCEKVGGDLLDLVSSAGGLLAYVADVSGHGIPAGVLMGNVKTALRLAAAHDLPLRDLLERVNRVLPAVKQPEMYATFAGLHWREKGVLEYCIAGHPPILHYHAQTRMVQSYRMEQFPLGLEPNCQYASGTTNCEPGDVCMLLSDGILEASDTTGSEFGLERVRAALDEHGQKPLQEIVDDLMEELESFGPRSDDQTILLVRTLRR